MTTTHRRIALLAGASITALGIASPAAAAPHYPAPAPHDAVADGTYPGTNVAVSPATPVDEIVICDIASDGDGDPTDASCFFGTISTGPGPQSAFDGDVITQSVAAPTGPVDLDIVNEAGDFAEVGAVAYATGGGTAVAYLSDAIHQTVNGATDDVTVTFANEAGATLLVDALAVSTGGTDAHAYASIEGGIHQFAESTGGDVRNEVLNDGYATIAATAFATGTFHAFAGANNGGEFSPFAKSNMAIGQTARALGTGTAYNTVENNGTLNIGAYAFASAASGFATAEAAQKSGIVQNAYATGGGDAVNTIANDGLLTIAASATAIGANYAEADAGNKSGISQNAFADSDGVAENVITNSVDGVIDIHAVANATAEYGSAYANAYVTGGIAQFAYATGDGGAFNTITNDGGISLSATANANASTTAYASAHVFGGILQDAQVHNGYGTAENTITNSDTGTIDITAVANAISTDGEANAYATVGGGIAQFADNYGTGDAVNAIANGGSITVGASAVAHASTSAQADAFVGGAIIQSAYASDGGLASNVITNDADGVIDIGAYASASGSFASADASVFGAVYQTAEALGGGDATNSITNEGAVNITAVANANAVEEYGSAWAGARVDGGIHQSASATGVGGDATSTITNAGVVTISADANANAGVGVDEDGPAFAYATVSDAIVQEAYAFGGGSALVSLSNAAAYGTAAAGEIDISAVANAISTTGFADAFASISGGIGQVASATGGGYATAEIANGGAINLLASAYATGSGAEATASVTDAISQAAYASADGNATADLENTGEISITAVAHAESTRNYAYASADIGTAIQQYASATGAGIALATLNNSGTLTIGATATATAETKAEADATINYGIAQIASADTGGAHAELTNSGPLDITAIANASGNSATADADINNGIYQAVYASSYGTASGQVINLADGVLTVSANANATATVNDAYAYADVSDGIDQDIGSRGVNVEYYTGNAIASVVNYGSMAFSANATAHGATFASASADISHAIEQEAVGGYATALLVNDGAIAVSANANAVATSGAASAFAYVSGVDQYASGSASAAASLTNAGALTVSGVANATGTAGAFAFADVEGVAQEVAGGGGYQTASFVNLTGATFAVTASAYASATGGTAIAHAMAHGLDQNVNGGLAVFDNAGLFDVNAHAFATGADGYATASATGHSIFDTAAVELDWTNHSGATFEVSASATAANAYALAVGITASVEGTLTAEYATAQAALSGSIVNDGTFSVLAHASGTNDSAATATGISLVSGVNTMEVTNTGLFHVEAMTANGGPATATGIIVTGNGTGLPPAVDDPLTEDVNEADIFTFTNDGGDIVVRQSSDGGTSWQRGMAIDVDDAPNPSVINLLGDGDIYGNIEIAGTDLIRVADGETSFDGIVNPACIPAGGPGDLVLDSAVPGEGANCGVGTLTIEEGGTLFLRDRRNDEGFADMYDGPSYVFVENFNVNEGGTIAFELSPVTFGDQPVGTYPQVFADTAVLEGTLEARFDSDNGLYDDLFYDNVIDANTRVGGFDGAQCVIGGDLAGSLLLTLDCIEDDQANIDLGLTRTPFDEVPGLNDNGTAVGEGLECIYDVDLEGGIADLLGDLFLITDPEVYNIALNQLAGASYANYLQSFSSLGVHYNDLLAKATDCEIPALAGSVLECRASSPLHLWGQIDYQKRNVDGDDEAGEHDSKRWSALIGIDASVGNSMIVGAGFGKVTNDVDDDLFGDDIDGDGWLAGLYGVYDPGAFYVKAMTSYSWFDGDSRRNIDFGALDPALSFGGTTHGDPDVKMWTIGLHGGARFSLSANSVLTPYANLDFVSAKMDEFIETGLDGANLHLDDNKESRTWLTVGAKWATQLGGVVPEVNLGYRHRFGDRYTNITEAFMCQTDTCPFDVISQTEKRGAILAGLSVGGKMGLVDLRLSYEGEFNSDVESHSGNFKIVLPLGGRAAPPPPPVVEAPPPPPPPPATQTCPDGSVILATDTCPVPPPPPPPPPPAPERG